MKKTVISIISMFLICTILAGCAAGSTGPEAGKDTPGTANQVTLKFTGWRTEDEAAINAMNEKFTQEHPDIKVIYEPVAATEYDTTLQTALSNGTAADIIMMRSYSGGKTVYSSGKIETLTTQNVPNLKNFPDSVLNCWSDDGNAFAVPVGMTIEGVHYNKAIFDACGVSVPKTKEELLSVCEKIAEKGYLPIAGGVGEAWYVSEEITSSILMATIGSDAWVQKLYNKEVDFTDPAYVQMLQTVKDLTAYYPDFYEGLGYEECQQLFIAGQAAMYMSGSFELEYFTTTNPDLELGCFAFPGQKEAPTAINFTAAVGVGAYSGSQHLEQALIYLDWLASDEGGLAYANGVLGFFSPNPNASGLENDLAREWNALADGKQTIHMLGYETMTESAPDYSTAIADTVYKMCTENLSAEDAAAYMQTQMNWYFQS